MRFTTFKNGSITEYHSSRGGFCITYDRAKKIATVEKMNDQCKFEFVATFDKVSDAKYFCKTGKR